MSLRERRDVVALCRDAGASGGVLFSLVGVTGSSYRRPGAHMVLLADGRTAGTLSGGCLEAELLRRAAWTVRDGAVVEQFSTAFDDTAEIPYGLGCGGTVDILAEPLRTPRAVALLDALQATLHGDARTILTALPGSGEIGASGKLGRVVLDGTGAVLFASESFTEESTAQLLRAAGGHYARAEMFGVSPDGVFVEHLRPAQRLIIFGAGDDAKPLARLGAEMGLAIVLVDSRAQHARRERFPVAEAVLCERSASAVPVTSADAVVLMTHSYEQDRRLLAELLPLAPRYLGLLGARHRSALLLNEAASQAGISLAEALERTHAPIGLELGGDGPEAVALAIMAELQHTLAGAQSAAIKRRLTLAQAQHLLLDGSPLVYPRETCALYAEEAAW